MEIRLHYIEQGEGFPLILLHGNGEDHTYFKRQMEPFARPFSGDCCGYSWTWRESTGHWTVYTVPIRGGLEIVFRSAWYLQMSSLGVFRWRKCGPIVCAEVSGPCRAAHTKRGKLGPVWRKAEDTDPHNTGMGAVPACVPCSANRQNKIGRC